MIQIKFFLLISLEESGSPVIISSATDIQATSLTVKWTAPREGGRESYHSIPSGHTKGWHRDKEC